MRRMRPTRLAGAETKRDANNICNGPWDDPCRLVESYCRGRCFVEETPETIIIAWQAMLKERSAPAAARSLLARLNISKSPDKALTSKQARLRALLNFVARRRPPFTTPL